MSLEDFLRRVAMREGAGAEEAQDEAAQDEAALFGQVFQHAQAVFATLAEAVSRKEWFDIVVES